MNFFILGTALLLNYLVFFFFTVVPSAATFLDLLSDFFVDVVTGSPEKIKIKFNYFDLSYGKFIFHRYSVLQN